MPEATRNPAGHGEDTTILTLSFSLGVYLSGLVEDPNLGTFILGLTTLAGQILSTLFRNWLGAPLASLVGAGAMKGAKLGVILLALWLPLGCVASITGQGAAFVVGQSTFSTCGDAVEGQIVLEECTVIKGAPASEQAAGVVSGFLATVLRMLGMSYGVPAPAPTP